MSTATRRYGRGVSALRHRELSLRRDRMVAVVVWAAVIALMAVMIWLAVLGGPVSDATNEFWHIMP